MMSSMRQHLTGEPMARSYAITHPTGTIVPWPARGWALVVDVPPLARELLLEAVRRSAPVGDREPIRARRASMSRPCAPGDGARPDGRHSAAAVTPFGDF